MRKFIQIITEASETTIKDAKGYMPDLVKDKSDSLFNPVSIDSLPTATAAQTMANIDPTNISPAMRRAVATHGENILRDLQAISPEVNDDDSVGIEVTVQNPANLPAVIHTALMGTTDEDFNPQWHAIGSLPGMMLRAVEMVAGQIFGQFTNLPVREIRMMTTVMGLNRTSDVLKMMTVIHKHGQKEDEMNFDFSEFMPAYQELTPDNRAQLWRAFGFEFLLMQDAGGHYVYAWPETDREIANPSAASGAIGVQRNQGRLSSD